VLGWWDVFIYTLWFRHQLYSTSSPSTTVLRVNRDGSPGAGMLFSDLKVVLSLLVELILLNSTYDLDRNRLRISIWAPDIELAPASDVVVGVAINGRDHIAHEL
jgi:hypothetical protein